MEKSPTMQASSSSSSSNSTSLMKRLKTVFKKAKELSILCAIEICVIYYGPDGDLKTWPLEISKVKDIAVRYKEATKRKKSLNLDEVLEKKENDRKKQKKPLNKQQQQQKKTFKYPDWYPNFDHYSPHQLSELIQSLERSRTSLQERLRFVEAQKQRNTNLIHQSLPPSSTLNQTQPLNPSKFSLYMYNHGDATLSQLPLSASQSNQLTNYQNHLTQQKQKQLYGFGQNMCMDNMTNGNVIERPCVSNTQAYSQESAVNNYGLKNHLMQQQQQLIGFGQNMGMMSETTNNNNNVLRHPSLSNTVPHEFSSGFQNNPYGNAVGNTSFPRQDMLPSYDENNLVQASSLPSLHTIPNNYCL